jgi:anti-anti-sigma regulatory factor
MGEIRSERGKMLKINRAANGEGVLALSGRISAENVAELKTLFESEAQRRPIILDLENITLVDRDAVKFLERCEADSIQLKNCPAYIREWIAREREKQRDLG